MISKLLGSSRLSDSMRGELEEKLGRGDEVRCEIEIREFRQCRIEG